MNAPQQIVGLGRLLNEGALFCFLKSRRERISSQSKDKLYAVNLARFIA